MLLSGTGASGDAPVDVEVAPAAACGRLGSRSAPPHPRGCRSRAGSATRNGWPQTHATRPPGDTDLGQSWGGLPGQPVRTEWVQRASYDAFATHSRHISRIRAARNITNPFIAPMKTVKGRAIGRTGGGAAIAPTRRANGLWAAGLNLCANPAACYRCWTPSRPVPSWSRKLRIAQHAPARYGCWTSSRRLPSWSRKLNIGGTPGQRNTSLASTPRATKVA